MDCEEEIRVIDAELKRLRTAFTLQQEVIKEGLKQIRSLSLQVSELKEKDYESNDDD